ncbi:MAG: transposase [Bacteroidales bacterium]
MKKNTFSPEFKAKVVLELIGGQMTINELAEKYQILPATLNRWHKQFQDHAADVFQRGATDNFRELEAKEREIKSLELKFGQLMLEYDWLESKYREMNESKKTRSPKKAKK